MSAYAVIKTGGKQYRVAPDDVIVVEKLADADGAALEEGAEIVFNDVLMIGGDAPVFGAPLVAGAAVTGEILEQRRGDKITIVKRRPRQTYRRKMGHRQSETVVRITGVSADGAARGTKKTKTAKPKSEPKAAEAQAGPRFLDAPDGPADDLSQIGGVGEKLAQKLNDLGIYHFRQIAAFTAEDVAAVDAALNFKGRLEREDWIGQAQELMAGGAPRAAVDKAAKARQKAAQDDASGDDAAQSADADDAS